MSRKEVIWISATGVDLSITYAITGFLLTCLDSEERSVLMINWRRFYTLLGPDEKREVRLHIQKVRANPSEHARQSLADQGIADPAVVDILAGIIRKNLKDLF
jgi:hypothetical protein